MANVDGVGVVPPSKVDVPFAAADLPMSRDGTMYHLSLARHQLANDIVLVGDPGRATKIASEFFDDVEFEVEHRGLRTVTGTVGKSGQRVSVVTSGMGTPSLEIVLNELMAINEIDPVTRTRHQSFEPLNLVRVGTSGLLQADIPLGASIITNYAVGLENTGLFYELLAQDGNLERIEGQVERMLLSAMDPQGRFYGKIHPYAAAADRELLQFLVQSAHEFGHRHEVGITTSSAGFNANQGRDIGQMKLSVPDIDRHLSELPELFPHGRYLNMEMESSFLFHFAAGHGYRAAAVCAGIANRRSDTFADDFDGAVSNAAEIALGALAALP